MVPLTRRQRLKRYIQRQSSVVSYYPMLEKQSGITMKNYARSRTGNAGTVSNALVGVTGGQLGGAYSFDGVGDRVIVTGLVPALTFSFVVFFKRNGTPDTNDRIIDQASGGPTRGWHLQLGSDGAVGLRTWNNSGAQLTLDYGILANNEWYVLGGSIGASSSVIYLNGVEVDTAAGNSFGTGVIADLQFGARSGGTSNAMSGSLQHFAIASGVEWNAAIHAKLASFFFNLNQSRTLLSNGEPLKVRGTNYSSNYLNGADNNPWYQETGQLAFDMTDMSDAGVNTVKIYGTEANGSSHLAGLDALLAVDPNVKVLVLDFVTYDTDYSVATGGTNRTSKINDFVAMVNIFKDRGEVIGYGFANENNLPNNRGSSTNSESDVNTTIADWYSLVNAAIVAGKAADSSGNKFFFTVDAEVGTYPGDASVPDLDVLGLNLYRGTTFTDILQDILSLTTKPVIITEWGRSRTSDSQSAQDTQADDCLALLQEVETYYPFISGHVHFKFTDTIVPGTVYGSTAPLAQGVNQSRTKYSLYTTLKNYMTTNGYGV